MPMERIKELSVHVKETREKLFSRLLTPESLNYAKFYERIKTKHDGYTILDN